MKFTPDYKGDLISRKRLMFELGESNMPKKYREFCLRVLGSERLSPTVEPKTKDPCEWCSGEQRLVCYKVISPTTRMLVSKTNYCPNCGRKL